MRCDIINVSIIQALKNRIITDIPRLLCIALFSIFTIGSTWAVEDSTEDFKPRIALKTNLLHDPILTPDIGLEVSFGNRFSVNAEGVYSWWSRESKHRYWRVRGGWVEGRYWFGDKSKQRALTGHHVGIYGSIHDYDFEFGRRGWQSPHATLGVGASYGYSFRIHPRLNLDLSARLGYFAGDVIKYKPQCNGYVCTSRCSRHYIGLTGLEVTLVWFPGKEKKNNPDYGL